MWMTVRGGHLTNLRVTDASGMIGAVKGRSRARNTKKLLLSGSIAYAMLAGLCIPGDAGAEMPAAGAGVTPGSSGLPPAGAGITPGARGVPPAGAGITPGAPGVPPAGAGITPGTPGVPPAGAGTTRGTVGGVIQRPAVAPFFLVNPPPVWVPGFWAWDGFEWVWVPGHWIVQGQGLGPTRATR